MTQYNLPAFLSKYFWDTDWTKLNSHKNTSYIVERLLEYGDEEAFQWLNSTYGINSVKQVVKKSRRLSRKSAYFYALYYDLDKDKVLCLQQDFLHKHRKIWKY